MCFPTIKHLKRQGGKKGEGGSRQNPFGGGGSSLKLTVWNFSYVIILTRGGVANLELKDKAKMVGLDDHGLGR